MKPNDQRWEAAEIIRHLLRFIEAGEIRATSPGERRMLRRLEGAVVGLATGGPGEGPERSTSTMTITHRPPCGKVHGVGNLRVIGYSRVSSDDQSRSGLGLRAQEKAICDACEHNGWELVEVVTDRGESGRSLNRPGILGALNAINAGRVDGLVVSKLDRATRSVQDFAALLDWFDQAEATFVALDLQIDTSSPGGRLVANIFASVAQWETQVIAARTKEGLAALRAKGCPITRPSTADEPTLAHRIAGLRTAGATYQAIADVLNAEGIPTLRGGAEWRVSSVQAAAGYRRPPARRKDPNLPDIKRRRARTQ